jgi:opacity protein-like surface antigen
MKRICVTALWLTWLVTAAGVSLAQAPMPSLTLPNTEVYGSFIVTSPDYGNKWSDNLLYGFEGGVSKGFTEHLWVTASLDFVFGNPSIPDAFGAPVGMHIKQFSGTVGPKYFILTGNIRPYGTAQIGYARQSSDGFYGRDHTVPTAVGVPRTESGFTYRFGGGVEWQVKPRMYWRVHWDWQPMPWGRSKPFYSNLGTGIGYRF